MAYTYNTDVDFGTSRSGLVGRVAYSTDGGTTWTTTGFTEPVAGSGIYFVALTLADGFSGRALYRSGDGDIVSSTLTLASGGSGYTNGTGYALGFTGGGGTGAAGTFDVVLGQVTNLVLTTGGSGYTSAPTLSFPGAGSGTGASATAALRTVRYASEAIVDPAGRILATPGNRLAANAAGQAGIDWGNVGNPTASVDLSGTSVSTPANVIHSGQARGGTINTITLATTASSIDNTYQFAQVRLSGGTGQDQTGVIVYGGYVGSTRVATVSANWATIPDSTTTYQIIPQGAVVVGAIGGAARTVTQDYLGITGGVGNLTVTSGATGNPIAGATVNAYLASAFAASGPGAPVVATTTTDANGKWSLSLSPSTYTLQFVYANEASQATFTVT